MPVKFKNALVCDNIYTDVGTGKIVLAGVYSGDITAFSRPAEFTVSLYAEFSPPRGGEFPVEVQVCLGRKPVGGAKMTFEDVKAEVPATIVMTGIPLHVDDSTTLEIKVGVDGDNPTSILKKGLILLPSP